MVPEVKDPTNFVLRSSLQITLHDPDEEPSALSIAPGPTSSDSEHKKVSKKTLSPVVNVSEQGEGSDRGGAVPFPISLLPSDAVSIPSDDFADQAKEDGVTWGVGFTEAHGNPFDGSGVRIAILDTGINRHHEAFEGIKIKRKNFTESENNDDEDGHGTHCAGTIFGQSVGGVRIGIAPGIKEALIAKVIGKNAGTDGLMRALQWAVNKKADIISLSLGYDFPMYRDLLENTGKPSRAATSEALVAYMTNVELFNSFCDFARKLRGHGEAPLFIAAAGNESERLAADAKGDSMNKTFAVEKSPPSSANGVIAVGAIDQRKCIAGFSNSNPTIVAPGVGIVSASHENNDGLTVKSGTSMACPHITGLAALYWQMALEGGTKPDQIASEVVRQLKDSAINMRGADFTDYTYEKYGIGAPRAPS